ncbi:MAG: phytanoyl-CoA dioxygenase family protein [Planctomycetota bacterium]|nr:MAG: phytanoyl-CoA dioxygenase family protein [Planctomycetota bacterium]
MSTTLPTRFSDDELRQYADVGFVIVRGLLSEEETDLLRAIAHQDRVLRERAYARADGEGGAVKLVVENELPRDTIYGAIVRARRVVDRMEQLLGEEVYHYHHKMILKEPRVGGAWAWHQDYGYWYNFGCLYPSLASCMIAVDRATRENGCLQVLAGSQRAGRVDHGPVGDQTGADPERVAALCERHPRVHVELDPGDAVFFHCNLMHRSDQNHSDHPRWAFICCYNARSNSPYKPSRHPVYSPLEKWDDTRVLEVGRAHRKRQQADVSATGS